MMEEKNNKISAFQFAVIGALMANSLFVGIGIINIFIYAKQDAWLVDILSLFLGLIPIALLIYIINYKPDKNILEKNRALFGKLFGNIINFIIFIYIFFMLIITIHGVTVFATTMYLTKTPGIFVAAIFVLTAIYAVIKGIETIARTSEILFFLATFLVAVIVTSLFSQFSFDELKPILANGFMPVINNSLLFLSYCFSPLIILTIIPKNDIKNSKNYHKYLIGGFVVSVMLMFFVYFLIPGVITPKLASLYRFPAYYVLRKINIGGAINNVENITSIHWFLNLFVMVMMGVYFLSRYVKDIFKIKKDNKIKIVCIVIGIIAVMIGNYTFINPPSILEFMAHKFPYYVSLILLGIVLITCLFIFVKKRTEKKTT